MSEHAQHDRRKQTLERAREAEHRGEVVIALGLYDDVIAEFSEYGADPLLADALRWKGTLLRELGETSAAHRCYSRSLSVAERCASLGHQAHALNCLASVAQRRGETTQAESLYARAATLASDANDARLLGMIEMNRGVLADMHGDLDDAEARYTLSLSAFEQTNDAEPTSWVLNNLGMLYIKRRDFGRARRVLKRGLAIARTTDAAAENVLIINLAEAALGDGDLELAAEECADALARAQKRGDHLTAAEALKCKAKIERAAGSLEKSLATIRIALYEAEGTEDLLLRAELQRELGEVTRLLGDTRESRSAWIEAAKSFQHLGASDDAQQIISRLTPPEK